jgi:hypothetical protein
VEAKTGRNHETSGTLVVGERLRGKPQGWPSETLAHFSSVFACGTSPNSLWVQMVLCQRPLPDCVRL